MGVRNLPVGLGIAVRGVREQMADSRAQRLVRSLEEQAGRAEGVAVGILLRDDDVQPAVAEASTPELLERECRRGEHGLVRRQAGQGTQAGRQVGVGVDDPRDQVVVQPEQDHVRDGVPRGFHPAWEVDRFLGVAAAVALGARGIQRQPDELLMGEFGLARFIGGLDFLGRFDDGLRDFDREGSVRVILAEFLADRQEGDRRHQGILPRQRHLLVAEFEQRFQTGWEFLHRLVVGLLAEVIFWLRQARNLGADFADPAAQHRAIGDVELLVQFGEGDRGGATRGHADQVRDT